MMINSENAEGSLCYPLESLQDLNFRSYITNYSTNSKINLNSTVSFVKEYCKNILKKLLSHNSFSTSNTHFLYRILDSKRTSRFQFSVQDLRETHSNLKQQKKFNYHDGFFRKSPFCTFSCINPGFGGPWVGHVMNIFSKWHFHYASKEYFWPKQILNFMHGFKSAILAIFHFCQNGTFEPVYEIQNFFWPKAFFWSIM